MTLSRVLCPVLVGRDAELSALEDALLSALRGDGGVVIAGGEAGMGKTRLVGALAGRARKLGCAVMAGSCSEAELALPYLPFLEAVGNHLASSDLAALRGRLGTAAEELAQLFPQLGRPATSSGDPSQAKLRLFESILMLLRDAASRRALLVILEDLQWADPATRELLDYATRRLRSTNVVVVATYRTDEMHRKHALLPTIQGWRRSGLVEMVELDALSATQVAEMVCAIFDEPSISEEFRDFLRERSEGNPFVLEEMLRDALDRGDIYRTENGWDRKTVAEIRIPPTVRDTILQRLERLSRDHVGVLSAASVMGRSFDIDSLADVAGVDRSVALGALEASVMSQLIESADPVSGRYRFRHALTREAIYEDLVVPRRQQLHSRTADVLKTRGGGAPVDLANHLFMAGRNDEAVAMSLAAAGQAVRAVAFRDAAELLERAAAHAADPVERARMLARAGDAYWNNNEPAVARRLLEAAVADLETAGLAVESANHRLLLGRCHWELMRSDLAREQFERVRVVLEPSGASEALALAYMRLGGLASWNGDHEASLALVSRAVAVAEEARADFARAWSLNFLAGAEIGLGRVEEGFTNLEESFQSSVRGGYRFQIGNAIYNAIWEAAHLGLGDRMAVWAERIDLAWGPVANWTAYLKGLVALERGLVEDAIELARSAQQRSKDQGMEKMAWRSSVLLAHALAENLRGEDAMNVLPQVSSRVDTQDATYDTHARVRSHLAVGDLKGAQAAASAYPRQAGYIGSPADAIADVAEDAAWLRAFLESLPAKGEVLASPRLAAARGRLALLEARYRDACDELSAAEAAFRQGGLLLAAWHTGRALAEAEFRVGRSEAAGERLRQLVHDAEQAGLLLAARLARETAASLGIEVATAPIKQPMTAVS